MRSYDDWGAEPLAEKASSNKYSERLLTREEIELAEDGEGKAQQESEL